MRNPDRGGVGQGSSFPRRGGQTGDREVLSDVRCREGTRGVRGAGDAGIAANRRDGNPGTGSIDSKDRDERNDRSDSRLSGRKRTAFGDVGEVDHLSGTWMGLGMIGVRLTGLDRGSGSGGVSKRGVHWPGGDGRPSEFEWSELAEVAKDTDHRTNLRYRLWASRARRAD
jgi:hypothetical protein